MFNLNVPKRLRPLPAYSLAVGSVAVSTAIRFPLHSLVGTSAPYATFYWAVFLAAWAGGFWAGVVATILSALAAQKFFVEPLFHMMAARREDIVGTFVFISTGLLTSLLFDALQNATESSMVSAVRAKASAQDAQTARDRERSILESIADGFISFDHQWRIAFVNEPAARLLGHRRAELLGKHIVSLYPNIILSESFPRLRKAVDDRAAIHFDFYDETYDRWFGNSAYPSASGVSLFTRDITVSRQMAEAVRESEERFRVMADSAPLFIWTGTREGKRDYVNLPFLQFTGRALDDELGEGWLNRVHPDDLDSVRTAYDRASECQLSFSLEYRMRRSDGAYRWMLDSGAPRISPHGDYLGSVGSCLDITDRRRAEQSLRESEAQLRLSMSVSQTGTWNFDLKSLTIANSPELDTILGLKHETGPHTFDLLLSLVHQDDRDRVCAVIKPVHRSGGEYEVEYRICRPDGEMRWLLLRGQAITDASGKCRQATGVCIDITDRKRFDERVQHAQKLESLGVLAGGIAHDFNNLLTGILGGAGLVLEQLEPNSHPWKLQRNVIEASERAAQLTGQMLAYSGKGRFFIEHVEIAKLVAENLRLVEASIQNKKVELKLTLSNEPCVVEGDPAQLQQVVMNLVINAAESIPDDEVGTVCISVKRMSILENSPDLVPGDYVSICVQDSGIGMDEITVARIFEPFFTTKFTGRGLGLAAVQGIVRGHKGAIRVTSSPGAGTSFQVLVPRSPEGVHRRAVSSSTDWQGTGTILIVDDEEMVRRIAAATVRRFGYQVVEAEHGKQAIELFRESPAKFSAILLDMTMPVLNGEETLPVFRQIRPDIKVIACSGYSESEILKRFHLGTIDAFIQKPYTSSQLAEKIRSVTGDQ